MDLELFAASDKPAMCASPLSMYRVAIETNAHNFELMVMVMVMTSLEYFITK